MDYYYKYRWCAVPECKNTSVKTPKKLWIEVPKDINMRKTWFKLAGRDPEVLCENTRLYFCEDHFDLEHDMENYRTYNKIKGSVKKIRLKSHCMPSRFSCNRKHKSTSNESHLVEAKTKRLKTSKSKDSVQNHIKEDNVKASSSACIEDSQTALEQRVLSQKNKAIQMVHEVMIKPDPDEPEQEEENKLGNEDIDRSSSSMGNIDFNYNYIVPLLRDMTSCLQTIANKYDDSIDSFSKFVATTLRNMPQQDSEELQRQILNLVMAHLNKNKLTRVRF